MNGFKQLLYLGLLFSLNSISSYATEKLDPASQTPSHPITVLVIDTVLDFNHKDLAPYLDIKAMEDLKLEDAAGNLISWKAYHDHALADIRSKLNPKKIDNQMQILKIKENPNKSPEERISAGEQYEKMSKMDRRETSNYLHGTHVTGILLGKENQADLKVLFFPFLRSVMNLRRQVKVFKDSQELTRLFEDTLKSNIDSISMAIEKYNVKVVNLSFGVSLVSRPSQWWGPLLPKSYKAQFSAIHNHFNDLEIEAFHNLFLSHPDTLFVQAAGNRGTDLRIQNQDRNYFKGKKPPNLVVVSSVTEEGKLDIDSSYGPGIVDVAARGEAIESTCMGGGLIHKSGTSMAAPIITGHLARYLKVHPQWKAVEALENFLRDETLIQPSLKDQITEGRVFNCKAAPIPQIGELDFIEP